MTAAYLQVAAGRLNGSTRRGPSSKVDRNDTNDCPAIPVEANLPQRAARLEIAPRKLRSGISRRMGESEATQAGQRRPRFGAGEGGRRDGTLPANVVVCPTHLDHIVGVLPEEVGI